MCTRGRERRAEKGPREWMGERKPNGRTWKRECADCGTWKMWIRANETQKDWERWTSRHTIGNYQDDMNWYVRIRFVCCCVLLSIYVCHSRVFFFPFCRRVHFLDEIFKRVRAFSRIAWPFTDIWWPDFKAISLITANFTVFPFIVKCVNDFDARPTAGTKLNEQDQMVPNGSFWEMTQRKISWDSFIQYTESMKLARVFSSISGMCVCVCVTSD